MATMRGGVGGTSNREDSAKATVAEQISQAVQSTSNLLHLMQQSSPAQKYQPSDHQCWGPTPAKEYAPLTVEAKLLSPAVHPQPLYLFNKAELIKLPKNLLAKASLAKSTEQVLQHLPHVISSLDAYMESSLNSAAQIKTISQLLSNMENSQLRSVSSYQQKEKPKDVKLKEVKDH